MSTRIPTLHGQPRPANIVLLLREAFIALNDVVLHRLAASGHTEIRPAHGAVFQYLDDTGSTVAVLAGRAQITKQAMAELVQHLERHGYVTRIPDPGDRRAKLVQPTARGRAVMTFAQDLVPEIERHVAGLIGEQRAQDLRRDLLVLRDGARSLVTESQDG
jgi:DNA-binding MarR family transcriptional regulator